MSIYPNPVQKHFNPIYILIIKAENGIEFFFIALLRPGRYWDF
jgi:hypothetical protein